MGLHRNPHTRRPQVAEYSREGSDLTVYLKNGETLRIANFYAASQASSAAAILDTALPRSLRSSSGDMSNQRRCARQNDAVWQ